MFHWGYKKNMRNVSNTNRLDATPIKQYIATCWILITSCGLFLHVCRLYPTSRKTLLCNTEYYLVLVFNIKVLEPSTLISQVQKLDVG